MAIRTVQSLDSLSLFGHQALSRKQLEFLPGAQTLLKKVYAGFSRVINRHSHALPANVEATTSFAVKTCEKGRIYLQLGKHEPIEAGHLSEDPELLSALCKIYDLSQETFPQLFKGPRPFPHHFAAPITPSSNQGQSLNVAVISDVNSMLRNGAVAMGPAAGKVAQAIPFAGALGGIGALYVGMGLTVDGARKYQQAKKYGDQEGKATGVLDASIGASLTTLGGTMMGSFLPNVLGVLPAGVAKATSYTPMGLLINHIPASSVAIGGSVGIFLLAGTVLAKAAYDMHYLLQFRGELKQVLNDPFFTAEQKALKGLEYLTKQISLTEGEWAFLKTTHPKDEKALQEAISKKLHEKVARLERRIGKACADRVANLLKDGLLTDVAHGRAGALDEAILLLEEVDKEACKGLAKQVILFLLSAIYIVAGVLTITSPFALALPIIFIIGAAIWNFIDSEKLRNGVTSGLAKLRTSSEKRWGESIEQRLAKQLPANPFQVDQTWKVRELKKTAIQALKIPTAILVNGEKIDGFKQLMTLLHLEEIDFEKETIQQTKLKIKQLQGLAFLAQLCEAIAAGRDLHGVEAEIASETIEATYNSYGVGDIQVVTEATLEVAAAEI